MMRLRFLRDVDAMVMLGELHFGSMEERRWNKGDEIEVAHAGPSDVASDMTDVKFLDGAKAVLVSEDVEIRE